MCATTAHGSGARTRRLRPCMIAVLGVLYGIRAPGQPRIPQPAALCSRGLSPRRLSELCMLRGFFLTSGILFFCV